jgi:hypothetical protein
MDRRPESVGVAEPGSSIGYGIAMGRHEAGVLRYFSIVDEHADRDGDSSPMATHRDDYPLLANWLDGVGPAHWWVRLLDVERNSDVTPPTGEDMTLGPLERLIKVVEEAGPYGLDRFRRDRFRDPDPVNVLSARLELLCAANLAVVHVPFAFGGDAEADLTWNVGTDAQAWLEIHRGGFNVFDELERVLEVELTEKGATLAVRLDEWPLELTNRNVVHTRISKAIDGAVATGAAQTVELPELGDGAAGVIEPGMRHLGLARILVAHGALGPSERYLTSLAARLERKINVDKAGQARKGSWDKRTVLLIDISTAHLTRLLGQDGLGDLLDGVALDWDDLPFAGVAVCFSHLHGVMLQGVCRYRPDLDAIELSQLEPALRSIGLSPTRSRAKEV